MSNLFENRALEKRHSLHNHIRSVQLLSPPLQRTIVLGLVLAVAGTTWACLAQIPLLVNGTGIIVPVGTLRRVLASASGHAAFQFDRDGMVSQPWAAQAWSFSQNQQTFDRSELIGLARQLVQPVDFTGLPAEAHAYRGKVASGTLLFQIDSRFEREELANSLRELEYAERQTSLLNRQEENQIRLLEQQLRSRTALYQAMAKLETEGGTSKEQLLQEKDEVDSLQATIYQNKSSIERNEGQLEEAVNKLTSTLASYIDNTMHFANAQLFIHQLSAKQRTQVTSGQPLMIVANKDLRSPQRVPAFLVSKDAAQTSEGMAVIATPIGIDRSKYGGIKGRVMHVAELPASKEDIVARTGIDGLAELILSSTPNPTEISIELALDPGQPQGDNRAGYLWTANSEPPFPVRLGDQLDVQITTGYVRPIELVIPFFRRLFGITPPSTARPDGKF